jgi:hypothetical protein
MKIQRLVLSIIGLFALIHISLAQVTIQPWEIHEGGDLIPIIPDIMTSQTGNLLHGDTAAYAFMDIPLVNDPTWQNLNEYPNGPDCMGIPADALCYDPPFQSILEDAFRNLDFTYFQTFIDLEDNTELIRAEILFEQVDDGARAYVFNDNYPQGIAPPEGDARLYLNNVVADLSPYLQSGARNRIVIVQFDDAKTESYLTMAQLVVEAAENTCQLTPISSNVVNETCAGSSDGVIDLAYECTDCSGSILYSVDNGETFQATGRFENLAANTYDLIIQVEGTPACQEMISLIVKTTPDNIVPNLIGLEGVSTFSIDCLAELPLISTTISDNIQAVDNCDPNPEINVLEELVTDSFGNLIAVERIWTATDASGNTTGRIFRINLTPDNVPPSFVGAEETPDTLLTVCTSILEESLFEVMDNCDATPELEFTDTEARIGEDRVITRTWTATDSVGNESRLQKIYRISPDTIAPTLLGTELLTAFELECGEPIPNTQPDTLLRATDNCGEVNIQFRARTIQEGEEQESLIWTWVARDAAGNIDTFRLVNTIAEDNTSPTIVGIEDFQETRTVACLDQIDAPLNLRAEDACDPNPQLSITVDTVAQSDGSTLIVWNYVAIDISGNETRQSINAFRVIDEIPPTITIANRIIEVDYDFCVPYQLQVSDIGLSITDNCDTGISSSFSQIIFDEPNTYPIIIRASDGSGNRDSILLNLILNRTGAEGFFEVTAGADERTVSNTDTLLLVADDLLLNDAASDGRELAFQEFLNLPTESGTLIDNNDGTYSFVPNAGFTGTVSLSYIVKEDNDAFYFIENGHFYRSILTVSTATSARAAARASLLYEQNGYLATITSSAENEFIANRVVQLPAWIGASDVEVEGDWVWTGGSENDQSFWEGDSLGSAVNGSYANWAVGQPSGQADHDYAYFDDFFDTWYDSPNENDFVNGYLIEYGEDNASDCPSTVIAIGEVSINVVAARPAIDAPMPIPASTELLVAPNPFTTTTQVQFEVTTATTAAFALYNSQGQMVQTWNFNDLPNGQHQFAINAQQLANGIYWLRAQLGTTTSYQKVLLTQER